MTPALIGSILILAVGLLVGTIVLRSSRGGTERRRLKMLSVRPTAASNGSDMGGEAGILIDEQGLVTRIFAALAARFQSEKRGQQSKVGLRLIQAGFRGRDAERIFLGIRIALVVLSPIAYAVISHQLPDISQYDLIGWPLSAAIGWVIPNFILDKRIQKRQEEIDRNLPSAIDLLAVSVEAGMGLIPGLARIGTEMKRISPILSEDLELVRMESSTGKSSSDALLNLSKRVGTREVSMFVNMLVQTERFGTSVTDALREYSDDMRIRRTLLAEERAATAALRMLFPTALIMMSLLGLIMGLAGVAAMKAMG